MDSKHYIGNITYVDLFSENFWAVKLDSIKAGDSMLSENTMCIIASSFPFLLGPVLEVEKLAAIVGAHKATPYGYTIDCNSPGPDITFTFGGVSFILSKQDYIIKNGNECLFAIIGMEGPAGPAWTLGTLFMQKHYIVFDWGTKGRSARIGFANAT